MLEGEKDLLLQINFVKEFIRVPDVNDEVKKETKQKIITLTQKLLDLETVKLSDLVDFSNVLMQKFESLEVENGFLLLKNENKITKCKIKNKADLVAIFAENPPQDLTLKALKSQIVIDENEQDNLKKQINDFVFCLYFKVQLADLQANTFYQFTTK